jgi:hypothetical protein
MSSHGLPSITFMLTGVSPLLLHNSRLFLNPLAPEYKSFRQLTSKKSKTDDDYIKIAQMEWLMGLYLNDENQPIIPGENLERLVIEGARKNKKGKEATAGVIASDAVIIHNGPSKLEDLAKDLNFIDSRPVVVQRARVMRCRPVFKNWTIETEVMYIPDIVDRDQIVQAITIAGRVTGLGDYRPKFGRFSVEIVAERKMSSKDVLSAAA